VYNNIKICTSICNVCRLLARSGWREIGGDVNVSMIIRRRLNCRPRKTIRREGRGELLCRSSLFTPRASRHGGGGTGRKTFFVEYYNIHNIIIYLRVTGMTGAPRVIRVFTQFLSARVPCFLISDLHNSIIYV